MTLPNMVPVSKAGEVVASMLGEPVDRTTIHRWATDGLHGVTLRTLRLSRRWFTAREWLAEFFEAVDAAQRSPGDAAPAPAPVKRARRAPITNVRDVDATLARHGLGLRKQRPAQAMENLSEPKNATPSVNTPEVLCED